MLHDDMTLARLMVYAQSIEESKVGRIDRNLKICVSCNEGQPRFKKRAQGQEEPRSAKVKLEKGGGSQNGNPTSVTCVKRNYGEYVKGTRSYFGCGKEGYKVRDCPTIASRGRDGKQVSPNVPKDDGVSMHSELRDQSRMRMTYDVKLL